MGIRDALLKTKTLAHEMVTIPDVGPVAVQALRSGEFLNLRSACMVRGGKGRLRFDSQRFQTLLVTHCVVDGPGGPRVFSDEDAEQISDLSSATVEKLAGAAARLCGVGPDEEDVLGEASDLGAVGDSSST